MAARRVLIQGRVQGVGFRYFVAREAQALGMTGWVRNLPDGRVEAVVAGEDTALDVLEGRIWQGPPLARVISVESEAAEAPADGEFRIVSSVRRREARL